MLDSMPASPRPASSRPATEADFDLRTAAVHVIRGALTLRASERVAIVVDRDGELFGQRLLEAATVAGGSGELVVLEDCGPRPHGVLSPRIREVMSRARASVLHIGFRAGEYPMRAEIVDLAASLGLRHAHMVGVTHGSLAAGLAASPSRIAQIAMVLRCYLRPDSVLAVRSATGTHLTVRCAPWCRWYDTSGVILPGTKANLPAGELVTSPGAVDGVYVADGWVGDAKDQMSEALSAEPLVLRIDAGRVTGVEGGRLGLAARAVSAMRAAANLDRVGLVSVGTNIGMTTLAADVFTNQKLPSFHLSLGLTFPERTGATWSSSSWIAFTSVGADVWIDGTKVMGGGQFLVP